MLTTINFNRFFVRDATRKHNMSSLPNIELETKNEEKDFDILSITTVIPVDEQFYGIPDLYPSRKYNGIENRAFKSLTYEDLTQERIPKTPPESPRSPIRGPSPKRKDSLNSSVGATSVVKLITNVKSSQDRRALNLGLLKRNILAMCAVHLFITEIYMPFVILQGSVSVWILPDDSFPIPITANVGSGLLALLNVFAASACLFYPCVAQLLEPNVIFLTSLLVHVIFYSSHLFPHIYVLLPVYVALGLSWGFLTSHKTSFLMTSAIKLSYTFHDFDEDVEVARRTVAIRRVARGFQGVDDLGFIFGSLLAKLLLSLKFGHSSFYISPNSSRDSPESSFDEIFDVDEYGGRLCGSQACPSSFRLNGSDTFRLVNASASNLLLVIFVGFAVSAFAMGVFGLKRMRRLQERTNLTSAFRDLKRAFRDIKLQLAAPMAFFIGMEQAFMYADFSKSYVVCSLGVNQVTLVFFTMGLLQSIAACTLSMLLRSMKRYYIVGVGVIFQSCLLLVQMLWKPNSDDAALFYVISAAWGVCNAIWEILNFTFLTGIYAESWEAPFAHSHFFRFLGLAFGFSLHGWLCNWTKIYILASAMILAILPFIWLEVKIENIGRHKQRKTVHKNDTL